jgi:uncharacterized protein YpmS
MIRENWRAILLTLLAANLVFMALLELQRRVIWQGEQQYFAQIERTITTTDKTQASYDDLTRQLDYFSRLLADTNTRVNNVEIAVYGVPENVKLTRDIQARVNNVEIAVSEVPENVKLTRDIQARVISLQTAIEQISTAKQ